MKSFNAYGRLEKSFGTGYQVWMGKVTRVPIGGTLPAAYLTDGAYYPAGTPVNLTDRVLTPMVLVPVTEVGDGTLTVDFSEVNIVPTTSDVLQTVASTFASFGAATAITAVAAQGDGVYVLTTTLTAAAGDYLAFSHESEGITVPNGYLYHDIKLGYEDTDKAATGAVVMYHPEGILIDRVPASAVAEAMAVAVPGVLQVND